MTSNASDFIRNHAGVSRGLRSRASGTKSIETLDVLDSEKQPNLIHCTKTGSFVRQRQAAFLRSASMSGGKPGLNSVGKYHGDSSRELNARTHTSSSSNDTNNNKETRQHTNDAVKGQGLRRSTSVNLPRIPSRILSDRGTRRPNRRIEAKDTEKGERGKDREEGVDRKVRRLSSEHTKQQLLSSQPPSFSESNSKHTDYTSSTDKKTFSKGNRKVVDIAKITTPNKTASHRQRSLKSDQNIDNDAGLGDANSNSKSMSDNPSTLRNRLRPSSLHSQEGVSSSLSSSRVNNGDSTELCLLEKQEINAHHKSDMSRTTVQQSKNQKSSLVSASLKSSFEREQDLSLPETVVPSYQGDKSESSLSFTMKTDQAQMKENGDSLDFMSSLPDTLPHDDIEDSRRPLLDSAMRTTIFEVTDNLQNGTRTQSMPSISIDTAGKTRSSKTSSVSGKDSDYQTDTKHRWRCLSPSETSLHVPPSILQSSVRSSTSPHSSEQEASEPSGEIEHGGVYGAHVDVVLGDLDQTLEIHSTAPPNHSVSSPHASTAVNNPTSDETQLQKQKKKKGKSQSKKTRTEVTKYDGNVKTVRRQIKPGHVEELREIFKKQKDMEDSLVLRQGYRGGRPAGHTDSSTEDSGSGYSSPATDTEYDLEEAEKRNNLFDPSRYPQTAPNSDFDQETFSPQKTSSLLRKRGESVTKEVANVNGAFELGDTKITLIEADQKIYTKNVGDFDSTAEKTPNQSNTSLSSSVQNLKSQNLGEKRQQPRHNTERPASSSKLQLILPFEGKTENGEIPHRNDVAPTSSVVESNCSPVHPHEINSTSAEANGPQFTDREIMMDYSAEGTQPSVAKLNSDHRWAGEKHDTGKAGCNSLSYRDKQKNVETLSWPNNRHNDDTLTRTAEGEKWSFSDSTGGRESVGISNIISAVLSSRQDASEQECAKKGEAKDESVSSRNHADLLASPQTRPEMILSQTEPVINSNLRMSTDTASCAVKTEEPDGNAGDFLSILDNIQLRGETAFNAKTAQRARQLYVNDFSGNSRKSMELSSSDLSTLDKVDDEDRNGGKQTNVKAENKSEKDSPANTAQIGTKEDCHQLPKSPFDRHFDVEVVAGNIGVKQKKLPSASTAKEKETENYKNAIFLSLGNNMSGPSKTSSQVLCEPGVKNSHSKPTAKARSSHKQRNNSSDNEQNVFIVSTSAASELDTLKTGTTPLGNNNKHQSSRTLVLNTQSVSSKISPPADNKTDVNDNASLGDNDSQYGSQTSKTTSLADLSPTDEPLYRIVHHDDTSLSSTATSTIPAIPSPHQPQHQVIYSALDRSMRATADYERRSLNSTQEAIFTPTNISSVLDEGGREGLLSLSDCDLSLSLFSKSLPNLPSSDDEVEGERYRVMKTENSLQRSSSTDSDDDSGVEGGKRYKTEATVVVRNMKRSNSIGSLSSTQLSLPPSPSQPPPCEYRVSSLQRQSSWEQRQEESRDVGNSLYWVSTTTSSDDVPQKAERKLGHPTDDDKDACALKRQSWSFGSRQDESSNDLYQVTNTVSSQKLSMTDDGDFNGGEITGTKSTPAARPVPSSFDVSPSQVVENVSPPQQISGFNEAEGVDLIQHATLISSPSSYSHPELHKSVNVGPEDAESNIDKHYSVFGLKSSADPSTAENLTTSPVSVDRDCSAHNQSFSSAGSTKGSDMERKAYKVYTSAKHRRPASPAYDNDAAAVSSDKHYVVHNTSFQSPPPPPSSQFSLPVFVDEERIALREIKPRVSSPPPHLPENDFYERLQFKRNAELRTKDFHKSEPMLVAPLHQQQQSTNHNNSLENIRYNVSKARSSLQHSNSLSFTPSQQQFKIMSPTPLIQAGPSYRIINSWDGANSLDRGTRGMSSAYAPFENSRVPYDLHPSSNRETQRFTSTESPGQDTGAFRREIYEEKVYEVRQETTHMMPEIDQSEEEKDMHVLHGKILIQNRLDETRDNADDFLDNMNIFDTSFHLGKDNPLYQSDPDIYKSLEAELQKQEEQQRQGQDIGQELTQDVTYETVERFAQQHKRAEAEKPKRKQTLSAMLLSKLSTIDSKDIHQHIDVQHHNEEIYGDIHLVHADGSAANSSSTTSNFESVHENIELMLKHGKAFVIIKVIAEKIVPIDIEFCVWRKAQAIVTRNIEIDLHATEQRRRLYQRVMETGGRLPGTLENARNDDGEPGATLKSSWPFDEASGNERQLTSLETLRLFSQIIGVTEGECEDGGHDGMMSGPGMESLQEPSDSAMDFMY